MDAVLHIEPITRETHTPLHVGHTDYIFYGEKLTEDGENVGSTTSHMRMGCPLEALDLGSTRSHIPLAKTFEFMPDFTRDKGRVYLETLHYLKDKKFLVPYRTKLRSGLGNSLRINHLPSLNLARSDITGHEHYVCDPRAEIVADILLRDQMFSSRKNQPLKDWITDDLTTTLALRTTNELSFDTASTMSMINRYVGQVHHTPSELTATNLRDIMAIVAPERNMIPIAYLEDEPIIHHIVDAKNRFVPTEVDLRSLGRIQIEKVDRIDYNPFEFRDVCDALDNIPLTDFNVDVIVTPDDDIVFYHEHIALDRLGAFADNDMGLYSPSTILREYLDSSFLNNILQKFVRFHPNLTDEIEDLVYSSAIKLKIIKTITDEAAVLLYRYDSSSDSRPLCGVYFDIALQSLAPLSIIAEPISN